MKNVTLEVNGSTLVITIDLSKKYGASSTGKSVIVASSEGIIPIPGSEASLGINVFVPIPKDKH